ncbi:archaetidylserine decarboxylase [Pseudomonadota bacterium]|nr:archaetidylserine decarboxylase [Pseudomonadota bacterium]
MRVILSRFIGKVARLRLRWFSIFLTKIFKIIFKIKDPIDPERHRSLNDFFSRKKMVDISLLKDQESFCSPAEGVISQYGVINNSTLVQAKGKYFDLNELFGGDYELSNQFISGKFFTIYLAPNNYHRVHVPRDGTLTKIRYIKGNLYSVSKKNSQSLENLYCKNERVVLYFESEKGHVFALILIGALLVGSIALSYESVVKTVHQNYPKNTTVSVDPVHLSQLDEVGLFNFGSTVICLASEQSLNFKEYLKDDLEIKVGQAIGYSIA